MLYGNVPFEAKNASELLLMIKKQVSDKDIVMPIYPPIQL